MDGLKNVRSRYSDPLSRISWKRFEELLADHYRQDGYCVEHCGTGGTGGKFDGGIDLKLRRNDEFVLVQCKHWNAKQVPHNDVHQLLGLMVNEGATGAILVTSGEFTQAAAEAANRLGQVKLVDGQALRSMLSPDAFAALDVQGDRAEEFARALSSPAAARTAPRVRTYGRTGDSSRRLWLTLAAVGVLAFVLLIRGLLERTQWTAGPSSTARAVQAVEPEAEAPAAPAAVAVAPSSADPCKEIIDHYTGTYIDHCMPSAPPNKAIEAELRAQQRRADEAIKVIEATTPEVR